MPIGGRAAARPPFALSRTTAELCDLCTTPQLERRSIMHYRLMLAILLVLLSLAARRAE